MCYKSSLIMMMIFLLLFCSQNVFGVSAESMQCAFDTKGNSVPMILLLMQERLYHEGGLKVFFFFMFSPDHACCCLSQDLSSANAAILCFLQQFLHLLACLHFFLQSVLKTVLTYFFIRHFSSLVSALLQTVFFYVAHYCLIDLLSFLADSVSRKCCCSLSSYC